MKISGLATNVFADLACAGYEYRISPRAFHTQYLNIIRKSCVVIIINSFGHLRYAYFVLFVSGI